MKEIEVGEYVRFDDGQIKLVTQELKDFIDEHESLTEKDLVEFLGRINHSKQLIELIEVIEVKDLVCFKNKLQNSLENEEMIIHIFDNDTLEEVKQAIEKGEIELLEILTHEQFEANCYKVGGEEDESN